MEGHLSRLFVLSPDRAKVFSLRLDGAVSRAAAVGSRMCSVIRAGFSAVFICRASASSRPGRLAGRPGGHVDSCPDMTVYEGKLINSCRMDEYRLFGGFLTMAARPDRKEPASVAGDHARPDPGTPDHAEEKDDRGGLRQEPRASPCRQTAGPSLFTRNELLALFSGAERARFVDRDIPRMSFWQSWRQAGWLPPPSTYRRDVFRLYSRFLASNVCNPIPSGRHAQPSSWGIRTVADRSWMFFPPALWSNIRSQ